MFPRARAVPASTQCHASHQEEKDIFMRGHHLTIFSSRMASIVGGEGKEEAGGLAAELLARAANGAERAAANRSHA